MKKQQGSGLIFAVVLLFVILGMVITLSSITVLETKMNQKTKSSVGAFYNSESGVEWALNQIATTTDPDSTTINTRFSMSGGNKAPCPPGIGGPSICSIYLLGAEGKVLAPTATVDQVKAVRSVGSEEGDTQRAIEAAVASSDEKYAITCAYDGEYFICCKLDKEKGAVKCSANRQVLSGNWEKTVDPWGVDEIGRYSLSCGYHTYLECCRMNAVNGVANCKFYNSSGIPGGTWTSFSPDISW
jgi:hypothetical protein